jgi:NAD(P)-dependent dehydrogenase (short-subunit alcohol dehydrogenase family)
MIRVSAASDPWRKSKNGGSPISIGAVSFYKTPISAERRARPGKRWLIGLIVSRERREWTAAMMKFFAALQRNCAGFLAYESSKESIRTRTKMVPHEWGKHDIRVNTILPSAMSPKALWYLKESKSYDSELSKHDVSKL